METKYRQIMRWASRGCIEPAEVRGVLLRLGVLPDARHWGVFIERLLLWSGGLALAFSVMFFTAYNWDAMGRFAKFILLEGLIIACIFFYWRKGADKTPSKIALIAASILLGVLLAFYGQTYQTGADPWQLFAFWALLIFPWVVISHMAVLWLLFVLLLNISLFLYYQLTWGAFDFVFASDVHELWPFFIFNLPVWLIWEKMAQHYHYLSARWAVRVPAVISAASITLLTLMRVIDEQYLSLAPLLFVLVMLLIYALFRRKIQDLFMLSGMCLSGIVVLTALFFKVLNIADFDIGGFFIMTILVLAMSSAAAFWLKSIYRGWQ